MQMRLPSVAPFWGAGRFSRDISILDAFATIRRATQLFCLPPGSTINTGIDKRFGHRLECVETH